MDKPELEFAFFNSYAPDEFIKLIVDVLTDANKKKAEEAVRRFSEVGFEGEGDENSGLLQSIHR